VKPGPDSYQFPFHRGKPTSSGPLCHPWCLDWSPDGRQYAVGTEEGDIWTVVLPEHASTSSHRLPLSPSKRRANNAVKALTKCHIRTPSLPLNAWCASHGPTLCADDDEPELAALPLPRLAAA
jgi:hypothetical protein